MKPRIILLAIAPTLIWGSSWFAIKFQLGSVSPLISISYRFLLAGILILGYAVFTGKKLSYNWKNHILFGLLGLFLFGLNYALVYEAEHTLTSGLIAVIYSSIIVMNVINTSLFLGKKLDKRLLMSAVLAVSGTALLFVPEFRGIKSGPEFWIAILLGISSVYSASLGNIVSASLQMRKIDVVPSTGIAMCYGGSIMALASLAQGHTFELPLTSAYLISLVYLALFASIIAFISYLLLLGEVGPERSAYVLVLIPAISMGISVIFEGYEFGISSLVGLVLIVFSNIYTLRLPNQ